jgi:hypothetical protein
MIIKHHDWFDTGRHWWKDIRIMPVIRSTLTVHYIALSTATLQHSHLANPKLTFKRLPPRHKYHSGYYTTAYATAFLSQQNGQHCYKNKNSKFIFCHTKFKADCILFLFIRIFLDALCSKLWTDILSLYFTRNLHCYFMCLFGVGGASPEVFGSEVALHNRRQLRLWTPIRPYLCTMQCRLPEHFHSQPIQS